MAYNLKPTIQTKSVSKTFHIIDGDQFWKILINKDHKTVNALKDISVTVPKGEFIGILGRNGSGKSTFLRIGYHE